MCYRDMLTIYQLSFQLNILTLYVWLAYIYTNAMIYSKSDSSCEYTIMGEYIQMVCWLRFICFILHNYYVIMVIVSTCWVYENLRYNYYDCIKSSFKSSTRGNKRKARKEKRIAVTLYFSSWPMPTSTSECNSQCRNIDLWISNNWENCNKTENNVLKNLHLFWNKSCLLF